MTIEQKVILSVCIGNFIDQVFVKEDIGGVTYVPDKLIVNMTNAAEVVFDQNENTQQWLEKEGLIKDK